VSRRWQRTAVPLSWQGPDQDAYRNPCKGCDGSGVIEDGEQIDVDWFVPALCGDCDGTGVACDATQ
jgi:DnaJ-class molecular chaperone